MLAVPGDPDTPTGGYGYDRRVAAGLRAAGWHVDWLRLPDGFPSPDARALGDAYAALAARPDGVPLLVDGLALGAMPEVGAAVGERRALVALVHHPLALETGLAPERAAALRASERAALAAARRGVATSRTTAATLVGDYGVAAARIVAAPPGTERAAPPRGGAGEAVVLLSVGPPVPGRGHARLVAALAGLRALRWRLTIVGDDTRDPATVAALRARIAQAGLDDRIVLAGALDADALDALWRGADAFVLASRHEGYGMAFAEAVARGLPVIGTRAGAIAEAVPAGTGLLVPPDDPDALREALRTVIADRDARLRWSAAARAAAASQPRWSDTVERVAHALRAAA